MKFTIKNTSSSSPKTIFHFTIIELRFINTYQVWAINLVVLNILFKILKEKEELNKSFYCKNETFVKNYYGEYCKTQCEECKLKSK